MKLDFFSQFGQALVGIINPLNLGLIKFEAILPR